MRPWGWYESLGSGSGYLVKRLCLWPGQRLSLQRHRHRSEHWVVVAGTGTVLCGEEERAVEPGSTVLVPAGALHRATAGAEEALLIVEVQRGAILREDDIERLADDYGRVGNSGEVIGSHLTL